MRTTGYFVSFSIFRLIDQQKKLGTILHILLLNKSHMHQKLGKKEDMKWIINKNEGGRERG